MFSHSTLEIFKEAVLISQTRESVDMLLQSVVSDSTAEIFRFAVFVSEDDPTAGTDIIFAVELSCSVLHIMA